MKNILVVIGSGLESGNTNQLSEAFIMGAKKAGHHVNRVFLGDKDIHGCKGCGACQSHHICAIKDDMQDYYSLFEQCDTLVLASPLYFWSISAQIKSFIDRLYAISVNDEYPQKETVLLMTCGSKGFYAFNQPVSFYRMLTGALGWKDKGMVLAGGCSGNVANKSIEQQYLDEAYQLGATL